MSQPKEIAMLKATVQKIRDTIIVRCQGRIIVGENFATLNDTVMRHSSAAVVVLDLAGVGRIDAGGLGVLLGLRKWAHASALRFKLMNARPEVERVFRLTRLDHIFEFWSVRDMLELIQVTQVNAVGGCGPWLGREPATYEHPAA
jgi:anti-anti-sigma factor